MRESENKLWNFFRRFSWPRITASMKLCPKGIASAILSPKWEFIWTGTASSSPWSQPLWISWPPKPCSNHGYSWPHQPSKLTGVPLLLSVLPLAVALVAIAALPLASLSSSPLAVVLGLHIVRFISARHSKASYVCLSFLTCWKRRGCPLPSEA